MATMVKIKPNKPIGRIAFCDFETTHRKDLAGEGVDVRVVGKEVHVFENGKDTKRKPKVRVKCGAMVVWDREQDYDIEVGLLDSPERMILEWGDLDVKRAYFHNSRFDLAFLLAWFLSSPERVVLKNSQYIPVGKQRIYLGRICKGKMGALYSVTFRIEGERSHGKPAWKRTVDVWDSAKIWQDSLDRLGRNFDPDGSKGLRKGATTGGSQALVVGVTPELREYCMQDCRVLAHVMKYYFQQVRDYCGQPNGFMTAASTTYNMALYWLWKETGKKADPKRIRKWMSRLSPDKVKEIGENQMDHYCDAVVRYYLPKLETSDLRRRVMNADGSWAVDEKGAKVYEYYDKVDRDGNVIREGKGRYSWMREGYKGATPLLDWKRRYGVRGLCGTVIVKDVNSMFPTQMVTRRMPVGTPWEIDAEYCARLMDDPVPDQTWMARIQVSMTVKKGHRATYLKKHGKEVSEDGFVTKALDRVDNIDSGEYIVVCEPEWEMIRRDYDVKDVRILEAVAFKVQVGLFAGYIMHWYDIKSEAGRKWLDEDEEIPNPKYNPALKAFAKLLINSFYGKFGSSPYMENHGYECVDGVLKDVVVKDETDEDNRFYLPLAIWTTAWARNTLSMGCNALGWEHVIYTDTDSWHIVGLTEEEATRRLESIGIGSDGEKLGDAPTEEVCDSGAYIRPKGYIHFDENGRVTEIKMAGANIFTDITCVDDLKHTKTINGVTGIWAQRLTGYNVIEGVLLMETYVNILEDSTVSEQVAMV